MVNLRASAVDKTSCSVTWPMFLPFDRRQPDFFFFEIARDVNVDCPGCGECIDRTTEHQCPRTILVSTIQYSPSRILIVSVASLNVAL